MSRLHLTADSHVHSEWSWDTGGPESSARGRMSQTCERAMAIGLPAVVFTEHLDFGRWLAQPQDFPPWNSEHIRGDHLYPPPLDVEGYLETIDRCRHRFPELRILTGVEFGQPHLFEDEAGRMVDLTSLDRINGSLHTVPVGSGRTEPGGEDSARAGGEDSAEPVTLYHLWDPEEVVLRYLAEVPATVAGSDLFEVFTHLDYPVRTWPVDRAGPFDPSRFEEAFRAAMASIAGSGRALEMNTRRLEAWMPRWWREEGGRAVTLGSDAHTPDALGAGFPEAIAMLEQVGFRSGPRPEDFWTL